MSKTSMTVADLARVSGFDLEDIIIELVRLGYDYAVDPRALIRAEHQRRALDAVGLHHPTDERKKAFWTRTLGIPEAELDALLTSFGFKSSANARAIPKGAHARLKAHAISVRVPVTLAATPASLKSSSVAQSVAPRARWHSVGQKRPTEFLTEVDVLVVHEELERDAEQASDPISPPGVKHPELLGSACMRPQTGMPDEPKYPTVEMAAAALVHSIVNNHPFHNGNKRTALVAMMVFLDQNNHWLRDTVRQKDLYLWILEVARHRILDDKFRYDDLADHEILAMAEWIRRNSRSIDRSERLLRWRELRSILARDFDCDIENKAGGKVVIRRTVRVSSRNPFRGFKKDTARTFTFTPGTEGRDVGLGTVRELRNQLGLTEEYYIDSAIFYGAAADPDVFIQKYQRLLRDLARV